MKRIDFYYDFACPYAYLAHTQIEAVCARAGAELVWLPFLLGGLFRAIGAPLDPNVTMPAEKARMNQLDMDRWADHFGVPLNRPKAHPCRTVLALRATLASGDIPRASKALFRAYWAEGLDVGQPDVARAALTQAGFDGEDCVRRANDPAIKDDLRARTDVAAKTGVFGAPTFVVAAPGVNGDLFWGQDRLMFVEKALSGWSAKPLALHHPPPSDVSSASAISTDREGGAL
jgi:2-hydroxychromene-2-carboxylate isomerase